MHAITRPLKFILFFISMNAALMAQPLFTLNPDYFHVTPTADSLEELEEFWCQSIFEALPQDTLYVKWKVSGQETCPTAWRLIVYDTHNCYMSSSSMPVTSNIDPAIGFNAPMPVFDNSFSNFFNLAISPHETPGCCQLQVEFSLAEAPDDIIDVAVYEFELFDSTCFASPTVEFLDGQKVFVSPNPANDFVQLHANSAITAASLYDLSGNLLLKLDYLPQQTISTASFHAGLYLLFLELENGSTAWQRIVVQH